MDLERDRTFDSNYIAMSNTTESAGAMEASTSSQAPLVREGSTGGSEGVWLKSRREGRSVAVRA